MSNETATSARHRVFSFTRLCAITANTLTELTRLKVFYVLLLFALLLIGSSIFMAQFTFQQEFQILKDVSLGAMSIFTSLLAIVATARLIPQDIEDRTVYPFWPNRCLVSNICSEKLPAFSCCLRSALW